MNTAGPMNRRDGMQPDRYQGFVAFWLSEAQLILV
jgi:hypothetical protein